MGYRIQDLTAATVLTPATDLLEFQQLSQSAPTSRKVTLAQLLASTLQPANNLSDIVSATAARANLGWDPPRSKRLPCLRRWRITFPTC